MELWRLRVKRNRVFVEVKDGKICRIFNKAPKALMSKLDGATVHEYPRSYAVGEVRQQVFERSKGECRNCGEPITSKTMHMHEVVPRSKGGEISLDNSIALCGNCHEWRDDSEHGNRRLRFS